MRSRAFRVRRTSISERLPSRIRRALCFEQLEDRRMLAVLQWASTVLEYSSQYSSVDWSAAQALHEPNVASYGDSPNAWAARRRDGTVEYLTLGYHTPVHADGVMVMQNWGNGFVTHVDVRDSATGVFHTVWTGPDTSLPDSASREWFSFPQTSYPVDAVRVWINTSHSDVWEEVDAVQLRGYHEEGESQWAMDVRGGGISIADGDTTPWVTDLTAFGSVEYLTGSVTHSFALRNEGNTTLGDASMPRVQITGAHAADFVVVAQPATPIAPGTESSFSIRFVPTTVGLRTAEVQIVRNVNDESPYRFAVHGTGTATPIRLASQWASRVVEFSSQFSSTDWSAAQALGAPNVPAYGDYPNAWKPSRQDGGTEFLTLGYNTPVLADGVLVIQTWGSGFVTQVDVREAKTGVYRTVWAGPDTNLPESVGDDWFSFPQTSYLVDAVRVWIDTDHSSVWEEVDAVQLRGYSIADYAAPIIADLISLVNTARSTYADVVYSYNAAAIARGADYYRLGTSWFWFRQVNGIYDFTAVDPSIVQRGIDTFRSESGPLLINIEAWNIYTQTEVALPNLEIAASMWQEQTSRPIGYYRLLPDTTGRYFDAINLKRALDTGDAVAEETARVRIADWMSMNDANFEALGEHVDFFCPRAYIPFSNSATAFAEWKWTVGLQILEAIRLGQGKPIYPIMWYHAQSSGALLLESEWIESLKYVLSFPGVSGVFIYSGGTAPTEYDWTDAVQAIVEKQGHFEEDSVPRPEIDISGNGQSIADGDTTPSVSDGTDFGQVDIQGGARVHTFTIASLGGSKLNLTGTPRVAVVGSADFQVVAQPPASVAAGSLVTFEVQFAPSGTGLRQATLRVAHDDSDENPYDFVIQGTGIDSSPGDPVLQWATSVLGYSSQYSPSDWSAAQTLHAPNVPSYGDNPNAWSSRRANGSVEYLTLGYATPVYAEGVMVVETWGNGFVTHLDVRDAATGLFHTVWTGPDTNLPGALGMDWFAFPQTNYLVDAVKVWIDTDHSSVWEQVDAVQLRGFAEVVQLEPEIDVRGAGVSIADGDTNPGFDDLTDFGSIDYLSSSVTHTFTVRNLGDAALHLTGTPRVQLSGAHADDFTVVVQPAAMLAPGVASSFQIRFEPRAVGLRTAILLIANNDRDEDPYDFVIQGTGIDSSAEIDISGNGQSIAAGDTTPGVSDGTDFGQVDIQSGGKVHAFTIASLGGSELNLTGTPRVEVLGAEDFQVVVQPPASVAAGSSVTFEVQFTPSGTGLRQATLRIANDDSDENPYDFVIQGTGIDTSGKPVLQWATSVLGFSSQYSSSDWSAAQTLHVPNVPSYGDSPNAWASRRANGTVEYLTLGYTTPVYAEGVMVVETWGNGFVTHLDVRDAATGLFHTVWTGPDTNLPGAVGMNWFTFPRTSYLVDAVKVWIDTDHSSVWEQVDAVQLRGWAEALQTEPEMDVRGAGVSIADGDTTPGFDDLTDFGSLNYLSGSVTHTFTVHNLGDAALYLTGTPHVQLSGAHADDFTVVVQPAGMLASGDASSFQIRFEPSAAGLRTAVLLIANNDSDEDPYDFVIQGTGIDSSPGESVLQWATSVLEYSSQYSSSDWSAAQTLHAPNVPSYGDNPNAWSSRRANGSVEYLTLGYTTPVYAEGVMVVETWGNGFVTHLDVRDTATGLFHTVWTGPDTNVPDTVGMDWFTFPQTSYLVDAVKVWIDTNHSSVWEQVDAVQLRGYEVQRTSAAANDGTEHPGLVMGGDDSRLAAEQMELRSVDPLGALFATDAAPASSDGSDHESSLLQMPPPPETIPPLTQWGTDVDFKQSDAQRYRHVDDVFVDESSIDDLLEGLSDDDDD